LHGAKVRLGTDQVGLHRYLRDNGKKAENHHEIKEPRRQDNEGYAAEYDAQDIEREGPFNCQENQPASQPEQGKVDSLGQKPAEQMLRFFPSRAGF
jgi:hypothetical protein